VIGKSVVDVNNTGKFCCGYGINSIELFLLCFAGEPQSEEDQQARAKYEEWLRQTEAWLQNSIQSLEQQVNKFRRTKKALNAKQRGVGVLLCNLHKLGCICPREN
jgi:hypothetical protein